MKLSIKWSRAAIVLIAAGLIGLLSCPFLFEIDALINIKTIVLILFFLLVFAGLLIRLIKLKCPNCRKASALLRWGNPDGGYCPSCGEHFEYDINDNYR